MNYQQASTPTVRSLSKTVATHNGHCCFLVCTAFAHYLSPSRLLSPFSAFTTCFAVSRWPPVAAPQTGFVRGRPEDGMRRRSARSARPRWSSVCEHTESSTRDLFVPPAATCGHADCRGAPPPAATAPLRRGIPTDGPRYPLNARALPALTRPGSTRGGGARVSREVLTAGGPPPYLPGRSNMPQGPARAEGRGRESRVAAPEVPLCVGTSSNRACAWVASPPPSDPALTATLPRRSNSAVGHHFLGCRRGCRRPKSNGGPGNRISH